MIVDLTEEEWGRVVNAMALAPYAQIAPLIEKVAMQIRNQQRPMGAFNSGNPERRDDAASHT
jgi:hypothetical protein